MTLSESSGAPNRRASNRDEAASGIGPNSNANMSAGRIKSPAAVAASNAAVTRSSAPTLMPAALVTLRLRTDMAKSG